jgi:hypothetical protein
MTSLQMLSLGALGYKGTSPDSQKHAIGFCPEPVQLCVESGFGNILLGVLSFSPTFWQNFAVAIFRVGDFGVGGAWQHLHRSSIRQCVESEVRTG